MVGTGRRSQGHLLFRSRGATINGEKLVISGGADGGVYAMKVNTGETVWTYIFGTGAINCSPVVNGSYVYIGQGEENPDNNELGSVICLDASKVTDSKPKLVWKRDGIKARYGSPILDAQSDRLYIPDEVGRLYCLDAKTGKQIWRFAFGRSARAAPCSRTAKSTSAKSIRKFHILKPGDKKCDGIARAIFCAAFQASRTWKSTAAAPSPMAGFTSPPVKRFTASAKDAKPAPEPKIAEPPVVAGKGPAHLQIYPADVVLYAGESASFKVRSLR